MKIKVTIESKPKEFLPVLEKFEYDLGIQTACPNCLRDFIEKEMIVRDYDGLWCMFCFSTIKEK